MNIGEYMKLALGEAEQALQEGEVPVGAIVVRGGEVLGRAHNKCEQLHDPTAHAELLAIRQAAKAAGDWRLTGCTLYVTLKPCAMCMGAVENARISRVVYGAEDTENCAVSANCVGGVLKDECEGLLRDFFAERR